MEFKRRRELKKTKIEVIPMIDTMFFLLVFFMLSSLALTKMRSLPVNLPKASTAADTSSLNLTITIDRKEQIFVDRQQTSVDRLAGLLGQIIQKAGANTEKSTAIINADSSVTYGTVVRVMDAARSVGITHFPLATSNGGSG